MAGRTDHSALHDRQTATSGRVVLIVPTRTEPDEAVVPLSTFSRPWSPNLLHSFQEDGVLERLKEQRWLPERIVTDNGPEFTSKALDTWADENGVKLHFIRLGKPTENAYIESFNGRFREECLNENWFRKLLDARTTIEKWEGTTTKRGPTARCSDRPPFGVLKPPPGTDIVGRPNRWADR
jgi:transposase InsO family protein